MFYDVPSSDTAIGVGGSGAWLCIPHYIWTPEINSFESKLKLLLVWGGARQEINRKMGLKMPYLLMYLLGGVFSQNFSVCSAPADGGGPHSRCCSAVH